MLITSPAINQRLGWAADQIERICYDLDVPVRIPAKGGARVLGEMVCFYAHPIKTRREFAALQEKLGLRNGREFDVSTNAYFKMPELKRQAGSPIKGQLGLSEQAKVSISMSHGHITFGMALPEIMDKPCFISLDVGDLPPSKKNWIPIGKTLESNIVVIDPDDSSRYSHILLAGMTGSGKTTLANLIIGQLAMAYSPDELRMFISSGKSEDVELWEGLPHLLYPVTSDPDVAFAMLQWLEKERLRRATAGQKKGYRIVMYLGELGNLVDRNPKQFADAFASLMQLGRSEKITVLAATQRPSGTKLGSVVGKSQFTSIIVGKMNSAQDGYIASGKGKTGVEYLPGNGSFITNSGVKFQAAFFASPVKPDRAMELVSYLTYKHGKQEQVKLPDMNIAVLGHVPEQELIDLMNLIVSKNMKELTINKIQTHMRVGYGKASRMFERLIELGVLGERKADNKPAPVIMSKLKAEVNG